MKTKRKNSSNLKIALLASGAMALTIASGCGVVIDGQNASIEGRRSVILQAEDNLTKGSARVLSVTSTLQTGVFRPGESLTLSVIFSEAVEVTGVPLLILETGEQDGAAAYSRGSGSNTLEFVYNVQAGHASNRLRYKDRDSLVVTSAAINDTDGKGAILTLPEPGADGSLDSNSNLTIEPTTPENIPEILFVGISTQSPGSSLTPQVAFDLTSNVHHIQLFSDRNCSFGISAYSQSGSTGFHTLPANVRADLTTSIYAQATANDGQRLVCTFLTAYQHRSTNVVPPPPPPPSSPPAPPPPPAPAPSSAPMSMGTNLAEIKDWSGEYPFVDAMKGSRGWFSGNSSTWETKPPTPANLDTNGGVLSLSPGQWLRTRIIQGNVTGSPMASCPDMNGRYTIIHNGSGDFMAFEGATINNTLSASGRIVIDFDCTRGSLDLALVAVHQPITDMKVIMPGGSCQQDQTMFCKADADCGGAAGSCQMFVDNYQTRPFHPRFLANIKKFSSIRFMDWMGTNNSTQQHWANRPQKSHLRYSHKGVPLEVMLELTNLLDQNPWFNIPERATDDYVRNFARTVGLQMETGRKATIEYSNEVWNGVFASNAYMIAQGQALALGGRTAFENGMRFYARRSVQIFNIFTAEMGGTSRIVRALAGQAANLGVAMAILNFEDAWKSADAYAIAPYFHSYPITEGTQSFTVAQAIAELRTKAVPEAIGWVTNHKNYLNTAALTDPLTGKKLDLIAYEGGQHLVSSVAVRDDLARQHLQTLQDSINRAPEMKDIYLQYLTGWKNAGGGAFVHFNNAQQYSKYGRWGSMEHQFASRAASPKYDALITFIDTLMN